jgi:hypothetical protein
MLLRVVACIADSVLKTDRLPPYNVEKQFIRPPQRTCRRLSAILRDETCDFDCAVFDFERTLPFRI